jgi:hypothetical protein
MKRAQKVFAIALLFACTPSLFLTLPKVLAIDSSFDPKTQFRVTIQESEWFNNPSYLALRKTSKTNDKDFETMLCPKWGEGDCVQTGGNYYYQYEGTVVLPVCTESNGIYCIESLELRSGGGDWRPAKFDRSIAGPIQPAVPEVGYPGGGTISLFESEEDPVSQNLDGYAIYASFEIYPTATNQLKPRFEGLDLRVSPFSLEKGAFAEQTVSTIVKSDGKKGNSFSSFGENIVWSESDQRGRLTDFPKNVAARVTLRAPNTVTGWLGGRLTKAEVSVKKINETTNELIVGGYPATIGRAYTVLERAAAPEYFKKGLTDFPNVSGFGYRGSNGVFSVLAAIKESLKDKSVSEETRWSLNSYQNSTTQCLQDDSNLVGLVTTNATVFDAVPPAFTGGVLTYKVGGLHYNSKGELTSGNYDLVMRSDVARCLYKFTNAPIQASISIAYETGEKQIATQVVNERDGWLYLGAYNFGYSSPTISVKLTQLATPQSKTKLISISCVKGKVTKKVTAVNPKCPAGYKKK